MRALLSTSVDGKKKIVFPPVKTYRPYDADKSVDQEVVVCVGRILQTHTVWGYGYHGRGIDRKKSRERERERLLENCVFGFDSAATTSTACVINTNYSGVATRVYRTTLASQRSDQKKWI